MKTEACGLLETWREETKRQSSSPICFPSKKRKVGSKADLFVDWVVIAVWVLVFCLLLFIFWVFLTDSSAITLIEMTALSWACCML